MNTNSLDQVDVEALYRLHKAPDFERLVELIAAEANKASREAMRSGDPRLCGAANALYELSEWLQAIPAEFEARNTRRSASFLANT